jgi:hypothetical protein
MKIRFGFVSNSSSSSFVVFVKEGYKPTREEVSNAIKKELENNEYYFECLEEDGVLHEYVQEDKITPTDAYLDKIRGWLNELSKKDGYVFYVEQPGSELILNLPGVVCLGSVETGPDGGVMVPADNKEVKKLLDIFEKTLTDGTDGPCSAGSYDY